MSYHGAMSKTNESGNDNKHKDGGELVVRQTSNDGWSGDFSRNVPAKASTPMIRQNNIVGLLGKHGEKDERRPLMQLHGIFQSEIPFKEHQAIREIIALERGQELLQEILK